MLVEQCQDVVNDRLLSLGEEVRLRKGGFRNAGTGILAGKLGDDVIEILFRAEALPFEHFHKAAISHMLETVASSRDMRLRLGRSSLIDIVSLNMLSSRMSHFFPHSLGKSWSLISLSASTPARAAGLRRSGLGSSVWRAHHEPLLLSALLVLPRGCTTCGPG